MTERYEALERLSALRDNGTLTSEEFESEKRLIITSLQIHTPPSLQTSHQTDDAGWLRGIITSNLTKSIALGAILGAVIAGPIPFFDSTTGAAIGAAIGAWRKI